MTILLRRFMPPGPDDPGLCLKSSHMSTTIIVTTTLAFLGFGMSIIWRNLQLSLLISHFPEVIQSILGAITLYTLLKKPRASRPKAAKFLIAHIFALNMANATGFVTSIVGLFWCFGPIQGSAGLENGVGVYWTLPETISNVAFLVTGLLTDGILVNYQDRCSRLDDWCFLDMAFQAGLQSHTILGYRGAIGISCCDIFGFNG